MAKKMLIDATHEEETRVAVIDGNRLAEFDYESKFRKPLKSSIFLAKVTRVEPSLQAAFVNFGGNRHGFLPFSEIHPDYFRIPIADREALMAEQEAFLKQHDEEEEEEEKAEEGDQEEKSEEDESAKIEEIEDEEVIEEVGGGSDGKVSKSDKASDKEQAEDESEGEEKQADEEGGDAKDNKRRGRYGRGRGKRGGRGGRGGNAGGGSRANYSSNNVETVGGDLYESERQFRFNLRRKYKIQEVIKRGQIMLIQVSKEERGNKGAAVSSYLSLPGRYCVLMPNSPRAGGVSRKIANYKDRARMKEVLDELKIPDGMSVIVRTAGVARSKAEIKRDLDYLVRLWDTIRDQTLQSSAPALIYQEADLIKRAIRDLYTRDIEEIHVSGEEGFKTAKQFMKMMIPSHIKKINQYKEPKKPLFTRYKIEDQINEIGEPQVTLKSGGYLVINPTEALVSVDVNSGKATKERHIEETALKTNLESAAEVARQLRLRDLGGLIVIDFIDMEDRRNNGKVERKLKEALSTDRARIQVGRISSFGLLELSRQRLNPSLTEAQYDVCDHCKGTGITRTCDAMSIVVLRAIEEEGMRGRAAQIIVHVSNDVALFILNNKKNNLAEIEARYNFTILTRVDETVGPSSYRIEVSKPSKDAKEGEEENEKEAGDDKPSADSSERKPSGRRRGRRGGRKRNNRPAESASGGGEDKAQGEASTPAKDKADKEEEKPVAKSKEQDKKEKEDKPAAKSKSQDKKKDEKSESKPKKAPAKAKEGNAKKEPKSDVDGNVKAANDEPVKARKKAAPAKSSAKKAAPGTHEKVNETPAKKKSGWWNKLTD